MLAELSKLHPLKLCGHLKKTIDDQTPSWSAVLFFLRLVAQKRYPSKWRSCPCLFSYHIRGKCLVKEFSWSRNGAFYWDRKKAATHSPTHPTPRHPTLASASAPAALLPHCSSPISRQQVPQTSLSPFVVFSDAAFSSFSFPLQQIRRSQVRVSSTRQFVHSPPRSCEKASSTSEEVPSSSSIAYELHLSFPAATLLSHTTIPIRHDWRNTPATAWFENKALGLNPDAERSHATRNDTSEPP